MRDRSDMERAGFYNVIDKLALIEIRGQRLVRSARSQARAVIGVGRCGAITGPGCDRGARLKEKLP